MATSNKNNSGKKKDVKIEFTISPVLQQVEKKISEAQNFQADETQWFSRESAMRMLGTSKIPDTSYILLSAWWD